MGADNPRESKLRLQSLALAKSDSVGPEIFRDDIVTDGTEAISQALQCYFVKFPDLLIYPLLDLEAGNKFKGYGVGQSSRRYKSFYASDFDPDCGWCKTKLYESCTPF